MREAYPYDYYVLKWIDKEFQLVQVTTESSYSLNLAKIHILANFDFGDFDVPVLVDVRKKKYHYYYYHPVYKVWYKDLTDKQLGLYFPFLMVDSKKSCSCRQ